MADDAEENPENSENPETQEPTEETNENDDQQPLTEEAKEEDTKPVEETVTEPAVTEETEQAEKEVAENQSNYVPDEENQSNVVPPEAPTEGEAEPAVGEKIETPAAEPAAEAEATEGEGGEAAGGEEGGPTEMEGSTTELTSEVQEPGTATEEEEAAPTEAVAEAAPAGEAEGGEGAPAAAEEGAAEGAEGGVEAEAAPAAEEGAAVEAEEAKKGEEGEEAAVVEDRAAMHAHFEPDDRPESPPRVSEKLSREGSVHGEEEPAERGGPELLEMTSPRAEVEEAKITEEEEEEEAEEEEEEEEEEMVFDRELLLEKYRQAHVERQQLIQQNNVLQTKLAEYFRKKKADTESSGKSEMEKSIADQEQRYLKYIANLEDLRRQYGELQEDYLVQIADLKAQCGEKQEKVDSETSKFMEFKKQIGLKSINSRSGKPIPPKELEGFLGTEHRKEAEVVQVRLKNIKLLNGLRKEELALKSKEELAEGLHLIDFEQLKIENQTYNEKIEERNEELLKLRKKITSTVQVLTHLKEKLQFVLQENQGQRNRLNDVDSQVARERDLLTRTKQSRDALRIDNNKLRQNCGLLGNEPLLRNFEDCVDTVDDKKKRLDLMRMEHAELTLNYNGLKRKIEQAKAASAVGSRL